MKDRDSSDCRIRSRFDDDYETTRMDRNKERHNDDDKNDKHRRRERSLSRHRDNDSRHKKPRNENKNERDRSRGRNHSKFNSSNEPRIKREPLIEFGRENIKDEDDNKPQDKEKPNFGLSGKLTEDINTINGVVIKYSEPQDARKPKTQWQLYTFKEEKLLPPLYVHRKSAYLMGRDRKIADIPLDHPSCSKQHAALQFRLVPFERKGGGEGKHVHPYLIDLESANGTFINNVKLEPRRYYELLENDIVKFGFSSREYVLLDEHSKDDELDDDFIVPNET